MDAFKNKKLVGEQFVKMLEAVLHYVLSMAEEEVR